jgi:hypothetical protein
MKMIYGREISSDSMVAYFEQLTGDIYKLLPIFESEKFGELSICIETLLIELNSSKRMLMVGDVDFIKLITNLEPLLEINDHTKFRRQIFKCTNMCQKILKKYMTGG